MSPEELSPPSQQQQQLGEEQVIKISDIKIGKRLRKKESGVSSLAASIAKTTLLHPIVINENNELIAGYRRIKAYELLGRTEIPYRRINFQNAIQGEYDENVERADFALEDIAAIYEEVQKSRIGHRPAAAIEEEENKVGNLPSFSFPKGPSDVVTGKISGHSEKTVNKIIKIVEAARNNPAEFQEIVEEVDNGDKSINYAYQQVIRAEDNNKPKPKPPQGKYEVLLIDPPWNYQNSSVRGNPEVHYAVMTDEEIKALKIPATDNSVLYVWATNPKLDVAIDVIRAWGFTYKTNRAWIKDKLGTGYYFRGQHELLLLAVKGEGLGTPAEADRPPSVLFAPRTEHSKKPEEVYEMIETMYPGRKYIEIFARGEARDGWKIWGLEANNDSDTTTTT